MSQGRLWEEHSSAPPSPARLMGIDHQLPTATLRLHMATPLRLTGILITDRGTILATGTMVITVEGAMDTGGKREMVKSQRSSNRAQAMKAGHVCCQA
jgi:hypothetical protein